MVSRIAALVSGFVMLVLLTLISPNAAPPAFAVPTNDTFPGTVITTPQYSGIVVTGSSVGATTDAGEPTALPCPVTLNVGQTVWYAWTSPASPGTVVFGTHGSDFDTVLAIYTGNAVDALTQVACNDDFGDRPSAVALTYAPGTTYRIQLAGLGNLSGNFVLNMSTGAIAVVNNAGDSNARDNVLTLREAIMLASGALAFGTLDTGEQATVRNGAAAGVGGSDLIFFAQPFTFPVGTPPTIALTDGIPSLSGNGDTISGIGAGVIVNGNGYTCLVMSGNFNRIEGLDVRNCTSGFANYAGVYVTGNNNTVGGATVPAQGLEISGSDYGIYITGAVAALGNRIVGNFIGVSRDGSPRMPNGTGITLYAGADFSFIGGPTPAERNVISNNTDGIRIQSAHDGTIRGNYIGTNVAGTAPLPNSVGIRVDSAVKHVIGGSTPGSGNLISGNGLYGIWVDPAPPAFSSEIDIRGNLIGTNATGTAAVPNGTGVRIVDGKHIAIGGQSQGEGNLISGNTGNGILVTGQSTLNTRISNNYIGTELGGTGPIPNGVGVNLQDVSGVFVGGGEAALRNVISGNSEEGILILDTPDAGVPASNTIAGNFIGTSAFGTTALPNLAGGVRIINGHSNVIGGTSAGARNVISGNGDDGVKISGLHAHSNTVVGNYIGVNSSGDDLGNGVDGIEINQASSNILGGENAAERNVISGNGESGINIIGAPRVVRTFTGPAPIPDLFTTFYPISVGFSNPTSDLDVEIDLNHTWDADLDMFLIPPSGPAIELTTNNGGGGDNYQVTLFDDEASTVIYFGAPPFNGAFRPEAPLSALDGLSPNGTWYLQITDEAEQDVGQVNSWSLKFAVGGNRVLGNYIGTNVDGTAGVYNGRGIRMADGAQVNTIGGLSPGARNVISGSSTYGIHIEGSGSTDNIVQGNYIGTAANGTSPVANGIGVYVLSPDNRIGGTAPGAGNVISGNATSGIVFDGAGTFVNVVEGNYIGVGANGVTALPNGFWGILTNPGAHAQTIGGTTAGAGNLIAHNGQYGIWIQTEGNLVYGNTVRNNSQHGIAIGGLGNRIGDASPGAGNVITANGGDGVNVYGGFGGTHIIANSISGNGGDGVEVAAGTSNRVAENSIFGNGELGIDLAPDGVTENDAGDPDNGVNRLQNYPVLTAVNVNTGFGETTISGSLDSIANEDVTISFFHNNTCDETAHGEGEVLIGSVVVGGASNFAVTFQLEVPPGRFVTATATRMTTLDTSEFSRCVPSADDADDDNDGFTDVAEGGTPLCNGVNNDAFDLGGTDTVADDGCPGGPVQVGTFSEAQFKIGTGLLDPCGNNGWPLDLVSTGVSTNRVDIVDLGSFVAGIGGRRLNTNPGEAGFASRWDLVPGSTTAKFINIPDMAAMITGPTGFPPMLGSGVKALGGPVCPFPP